MNELWSQQDGATRHTAQSALHLLKKTRDVRIISCNAPINWHLRLSEIFKLYFVI